jgi:hypothetical protein
MLALLAVRPPLAAIATVAPPSAATATTMLFALWTRTL